MRFLRHRDRGAGVASSRAVQFTAGQNEIAGETSSTLKAFADHGEIGAAMPDDGGNSSSVISKFAEAGIDPGQLAEQLQRDGAESFVKSWNELIEGLSTKIAALAKAGSV